MARRLTSITASIITITFLLNTVAAAVPPRAPTTERELLARFAHEPSVQEVQDSAIRYYQVHPDRIKMLMRNAQLKALVPSLSGEFSSGLTTTRRTMFDGLYPTIVDKEREALNGDNNGFRIQASWVLDRLVFNAEVLDVQSLIGILDGIVREVTTIYYIRRRLQIDMVIRPPTDLATSISQRIRIEELTGLIDAMTGSFMTHAIRKAIQQRRQERRPTAIPPINPTALLLRARGQ